MLKPINSFLLPQIKKITPHSYLHKSSDWKAAACFAMAVGFLIAVYWRYRSLTSKLLLKEKPSLPTDLISPSTPLQPNTPAQFSKATNSWSIHSSPDRIIAAFGRELDPSAGQETWTSESFTLKEGQFALSIQHQQTSEEFEICLQCIRPFGEVQVHYSYTLQGHDISGEKFLSCSQANSKHLLGKITLNNESKPPLVSLMVILQSHYKA